jgi:uncharacterized membrane protein YfcA
MVAYFYTSDADRMRAKANTQFFFAATAAAGVATHAALGNINGFTLLRSVPFVPVVVLGTWAGVWLSGRIRPEVFRRLTDLFLMALGASLIVTNL